MYLLSVKTVNVSSALQSLLCHSKQMECVSDKFVSFVLSVQIATF